VDLQLAMQSVPITTDVVSLRGAQHYVIQFVCALRQVSETTQWPKEKDRKHNGQKRRTDNTMAKRTNNDLQHTTLTVN
jgi:hypothetical protein